MKAVRLKVISFTLAAALQTGIASGKAADVAQPEAREAGTNLVQRPKLPSRLYLPSQLAEVVRLAKAGISEDVIVSYIPKKPPLSVTPAQLIALRDIGISPVLLKALVEHVPS